MAKKSLRFRHEPLSTTQIRLIQISSTIDQPIECSIAVYALSETPTYTCLSYMWRRTRTDTEQCPIRLNGKPYKVGQNLADFLYIAPRKYPGVYFWIDALCIDQENLEERSDQVRRMSQIYNDAVRTVAWLGQSDGAENLQFHNQSWRPRVARRSSGMSPQETAMFNQIVQHDYWTRTWIVQEQRFSQNMEILMGDVKVSASRLIELNDLASRLVRLYGRQRSQVVPFKTATRALLLGNRTEKLPMISLLKLHHRTACADVRDKIHALLAMANEGSLIEIDYTSTRVDLALRTIWACRDSFCMCLPAMLFRTLGVDRVDAELQNLPHPFLEILIGCYHHEEDEETPQLVLRTCKCKDQDFSCDANASPQKGIVLCLKAICGFRAGAHMLLGAERVIYWGSAYPPTLLQCPPLVNVRYAKGERFEMTVSISFTPVSLFEFTCAAIAMMNYRERCMQGSDEMGDSCQRMAKNIFYRVLGHGLCAENSSNLVHSTIIWITAWDLNPVDQEARHLVCTAFGMANQAEVLDLLLDYREAQSLRQIFTALYTHLIMDTDFDFIEYPPQGSHTHTIVFLHGRGDNAKNFSASLGWSPDSHGRVLPQIFPTFRWVFPQAKLIRRAARPHDEWSQWFDVWNTDNFLEREELQAEGLKRSVAGIRKILSREAAMLEGRWDRIILAGISQGAATSVHTLFNLNLISPSFEQDGMDLDQPKGLAAFLGFSCRLPFPNRSLADTRRILNLEDVPEHDEVLRHTPILLEHCANDPLVLLEKGEQLRDALGALGAQVVWKQYPDGGHWFNSPAGIDDVVTFVNRHVLHRAPSQHD